MSQLDVDTFSAEIVDVLLKAAECAIHEPNYTALNLQHVCFLMRKSIRQFALPVHVEIMSSFYYTLRRNSEIGTLHTTETGILEVKIISKLISKIPLTDIAGIELYIGKCRKTLAQVAAEARKKRPECDVYIINGGMWNPDGSPCRGLKVDGNLLSLTPWGDIYGYGWNTPKDLAITTDWKRYRNYLSCTYLIGPGKRSYDKAQGGRRGRSAIGMTGDKLVLYCSSDGSGDAQTPEQLRDELAAMGCKSAVMLDSGGSSQCDFNGVRLYGDGRKCHNYIVVYTKKKEDKPVGKYRVTPEIGLNIRRAPDKGAAKVGGYPCGAVVEVLEERSGWARTDKGWIYAVHLEPVRESGAVVGGLAVQEDLVPKGKKNRPALDNPDLYITVHETGNFAAGADAKAHASYLKRRSAEASRVSWHYTVDDHSVYRHLPDAESAYHATDGADGPGNRTSIGIEICVNAGGDFEKAKRNAAALVRQLRERYGIPLDHVVQHHNWYNKDCPHTMRNTPGAWEAFLALCEGRTAPSDPLAEAVDTVAAFLVEHGQTMDTDYWKGGKYAQDTVRALFIKLSAVMKE